MIIRCVLCHKSISTPLYGAKYDKGIADGICPVCLASNDQEPTPEQLRQFELDEIETAKAQYMSEMDVEEGLE